MASKYSYAPPALDNGAGSIPYIQVIGELEFANGSPPYGYLHTNKKARSISRCIYNSGHLLYMCIHSHDLGLCSLWPEPIIPIALYGLALQNR